MLFALVWSLPTAAAADSTASSERIVFDIPRQRADSALVEFAAQADVTFIFPFEEARRKTANRLKGTYTRDEAIAVLLRGTGLRARFDEHGALAVHSIDKSETDGDGMTNTTTKGLGGIAATILGLLTSQGARAQEGDSGAAQSLQQLEEIVVTAQKRVERLQDVPISISVLSGEVLERSSIAGATEALSLIPGAKTTVGFQGGGTQLSLRGVSASGPLFNGSGTVGYYIDTAPFGLVKTAVVPDSNVYDLERIEVLRGPQGTLYGASALNGVVRILTHPANLDEFEFKTRTSVSSIEDGAQSYRGDVAVNVPIVEGKLAARVVLGYEDVGGWIDRPNARDANDGTLANARLKLNARPVENLSVGVSAWISRADYDSPPIGLDNNTTSSLVDQELTTDYDIFGLQLGYDFPGVALSSSTTYLDFANSGDVDLTPLFGGAVPGPVFFESDFEANAFSQEVLLSSADEGAWRWSAGAFYRDAEDSIFQPGMADYVDTSKSFAVFGELTRKLLQDRFEVTAGLRYFEDEVTQRDNASAYRATATFDAFSPRFILKWLPDEALTFYASYSEGFRSGFNQNSGVIALAPQFPPLREDTLINYEVGGKADLFDGAMSVDAAVYFIDWQDVQQSIFVQTAPAISTAALINGESASGPGIDLAVTVRPIEGLTLGVNGSWNDLTLDEDVVSAGVALFDKGDRLNVSAEKTFGALAEYAFGLAAGFKGRLSLSGSYTSEPTSRYMSGTGPGTPPSVSVVTSDDQLFVRGRFAVESGNGWTITLFGDNLNNESGSPSRYLAPFLDTRVRPRTIGVQFDYQY